CEPAEILVGILPLLEEIHVAGDVEHQAARDLSLDEHLLLQVGSHVQDTYLAGVDAIDFGEALKQVQPCRAWRSAERLAFDILYSLDWPIRLGDKDERGSTVDLINHHRL